MACRLGISSMSLGRAWVHNFPEKLAQAQKYGYKGIEVFYEDLEYPAKGIDGGKDVSKADIIRSAGELRSLCDRHQLEVICLQPFMGYEGILDQDEHNQMIQKLRTWIEVAHILGTDIIQIPSNIRQDSGITGDRSKIVSDMKQAADIGLHESPVIRFAYENLAWGAYVDTWEDVWEIVKEVDRPNFGMCLDTFNITGRIWADPSSEDGKNPGADEILKQSLRRMKEVIDIKKVWYVQVVGAEKMETPLVQGHPWWKEAQPNRMSWSRNARLFAYEEDRGQYLPIYDVARVIFQDLQFRGWVSLELFSRTMAEPDASVPEEHAKRGAESWAKLVHQYQLDN